MLATTDGVCTATKRFWRSAVWATVAAAVLLIESATWAQQQTADDPNAPALRLIKIIPINGTAGNRTAQMFSFDISFIDPATGLYYLADRSNAALDVIDTTGAAAIVAAGRAARALKTPRTCATSAAPDAIPQSGSTPRP